MKKQFLKLIIIVPLLFIVVGGNIIIFRYVNPSKAKAISVDDINDKSESTKPKKNISTEHSKLKEKKQTNKVLFLGLKTYKSSNDKINDYQAIEGKEKPIAHNFIEPRYCTIIIDLDDTKNQITVRDDIFLLKNQDIWHVGTVRVHSTGWTEDFLISCSEKDSPKNLDISYQSFKNTYGHELLDINFVCKDFLSFDEHSNGYFNGGWDSDNRLVIPLENEVFNSERRLKISQILSNDVKDEFIKAGEQAFKKSKISINLSEMPEEEMFGFSHKNGAFDLIGRLSSSAHASEGYYEDFPVKTNLAKKIFGDPLYPKWGEIRKEVKGAKDAVTYPDRNIIAILKSDEIVLYKIKDGKIGEKIIEYPIKGDFQVVMAQWENHTKANNNLIDELKYETYLKH